MTLKDAGFALERGTGWHRRDSVGRRQDVPSRWTARFSALRGSERTECGLLAADARGDLAYTVGIERYRASTTWGADVDNTLRVTHVYRREPGGWRIVHRHGDHMPADPVQSTTEQ